MSLDAYYHAPMSLAPFITKLEISATTMSKGTETALKHYPVPRKWPSHTTTLEISEMGLYIPSSPSRSAAVAARAGFPAEAAAPASASSGSVPLALVGAYVPLARVATASERGCDAAGAADKTAVKWKLEKHFKVGDSLRCRIVAANILEGVTVL